MANSTQTGRKRKRHEVRSEILDSALPANVEAETKFIACLLKDPRHTKPAVDAGFSTSIFIDPINQEFAHGILSLHTRGQHCDPAILLPWLKENTTIDNPGDEYFRIAREVAITACWRDFLDTTIDAFRRRSARLYAEQLLIDSTNGKSTDAIFAEGRQFFEQPGDSDSFQPIVFGQLADDNPGLNDAVIHGLLRRGETANFVSASKVGKSWLNYHLALSTATGGRFLETFDCEPGRVLIVDNELHKRTIAFRLSSVADAMGIPASSYRMEIDVWPLRGQLLDLHSILRLLDRAKAGRWLLIILDAWYRALPEGISENDNGQIMALYNAIDKATERLNCAWVNIHHSSKGAQGDKSVTDVGAGAGSQSRAADSHIILRPHQDEGAVVLDAAVRSFPPIEPVPLRWNFPLWRPDDSLNPRKLKGALTAKEQRQNESDNEGIAKLAAALEQGAASVRILMKRSGLSRGRCERLLNQLESAGRVRSTKVKIRGNPCEEYQSINLDNENGNQNEPF